ncbi:ATP-binding protein [Streptomyces sp. NEAU-YJ-81]|uniref:ATP-binding protein n=1 Tax=Streptomyces sp. NEAU-YJ-81 TaxID=2820288 RepID=UPI001ABD0675|nr:ATP-binding protein [Streptomyces sp. NEAU-YJ-81]MBO3676589.1 ATP-binding protein [Streptomyces sp. NEAU-YJ-81]
MDPKNRGSQEHGWDESGPGAASSGPPAADTPGAGSPSRPPAPPGLPGDVPTPPLGSPVPGSSASSASSASSVSSDPSGPPARTARIVTGDYLLTVNPVDGSEIEPCPPGERPARPERHGPDERAELRHAAAAPRPSGAVLPDLPMLERDEERERLARLLARGRSVRVTGPSGAGRSTLLEAVAADCERLAPDGVVRLSGYHRTPADLLHDLYAAVFSAPLYRPERAELLESVQGVGAVVVLDDIDFGGAALDEFLDATPECAFLISATPDVPAPSPDSHLEEVFLSGLSRTAGLELLARAARRPLEEDEASWAADLWFESEGLPLRFVQAGALLRQRDALRDDPSAREAGGGHDVPLPSIAEAASPAALLAGRLSEAAHDALRFAVALGGECPHQVHLRALSADTHADAALGELLGCGLVTAAGAHHRLAARVTAQLAEEGYADADAGRAHAVAGHYAWWAGHPSVAPERVAAEADAILAAMTALIGSREAGHADAAVLLARAAAPAFAAALHWGAWERAVRHGQEAARLAGQVADEAYFHHELGVLALCTGHLDRARAELEASIGLRGVLADKRGTVAGRRALALVADRSPGSAMAGAFGASGGSRKGEDVTPPAAGAAPDDTETTIVTPKAATTTPMAAMGTPAPTKAVTAVVPAVSRTTVAASATPSALASASPSAPAGPSDGEPRGLRRLAVQGARRNVVAASAGVLLVAVLGTVVTLGATSGDDSDSPSDKVKPDRSASQQDDDKGLTADEPTRGTSQAPQPGLSGTPKASTSPTAPSSSGSPSGTTASSDPSSTSGSPSDTEQPPSPPSSDPTTKPPTTKPPTTKPPTPTGEPTKPTPTTSAPTPTSTGDTSNTASAPTTHAASGTASPVA